MLYEPIKTFTNIIPSTDTYFGVPFTPLGAGLPTILLHFDGLAGSTEFIDSTWQHPTIVNSGGVVIDTAQSVFGGSSALFNFNDLQLDGSAAFAFGLNDFTIDCWIFITNITFTQPIITTHTSDISWYLHVNNNGQLIASLNFVDQLASAVGAVVINTWYHVALTRASGVSRLFLNGQLQTAGVNGGTYIDTNNYNIRALYPRIGINTNGTAGFVGNMDEFRIINGVAAWTNDFTPPTTPYLPA